MSDVQESLWVLVWTVVGGVLGLLIRPAWRFALAALAGLIVLTLIAQELIVP